MKPKATAIAFLVLILAESWSCAQDRDQGIPTSMFGTSVDKGEWLIYPFYEYYRDKDAEYEPTEFGIAGAGATAERKGRYRAHEELIFVSHGFSKRWAAEIMGSSLDLILLINQKVYPLLNRPSPPALCPSVFFQQVAVWPQISLNKNQI